MSKPQSPLAFRDYRLFWISRFCAVLAQVAHAHVGVAGERRAGKAPGLPVTRRLHALSNRG